jgi:hypothetical protein
LGKTYRDRPSGRPRHSLSQTFRCRHCKLVVGPVHSGGHHRNHCPYCLWSRHVDGKTPGDRSSSCGGAMAPVGTFNRPKGEWVVVHRCLSCGFERHNRIAGDDLFDLVALLPGVAAPRGYPGAEGRPQREKRHNPPAWRVA